ncbi:MAG TPA: HAMP domain-containing sensor histidine kinase [Vicinamibacterales bacterium]|nr:HAMP domain-containing sensor histidine kinase [Vicinamibacterales bacterium]
MPFKAKPLAGYATAIAFPIIIIIAVAWLNLPPFLLEHIVVLFLVFAAIRWGVTPAAVAAVVAVVADNLLLREPIGRPTISGFRDAVDLVFFGTIAIVVSGLMREARSARAVAQAAADRERLAREDLDALIQAITHDLATPLSVLRNTVQFAQRRANTEVDWAQLLKRLDTASTRATALVRTLADARQIDGDSLRLEIARHDLGAMVAPIVSMMDRVSERHPLLYTPPDGPVMIDADAERVQRMVENLIANAIKYSPDGGAIEVSVSVSEAAALLRVRDHGVGIPAEALPHIFTRSYRAPNARSHASGLGLGLSIAAEIVHRHGGTIVASAAPGVGTVFTVRFPINHLLEKSYYP